MELSSINDSHIDGYPLSDLISYSKERFFMNPSTQEVHSKVQSKYIMSHKGWDWRAAPHHTLDWYKHFKGSPPRRSGGS